MEPLMFQLAVPSMRMAPGVEVVPPPNCMLNVARSRTWVVPEVELSLSVPIVALAVL